MIIFTSSEASLKIVLPTTSGKELFIYRPGVYILLTVDWEGDALTDKNLDAMVQFGIEFPNVPLLHFLNPAYFTKPNVDTIEVARKIHAVLRPCDEQGLHLHGWKSLIENAGVTFRSVPTWADGYAASSSEDFTDDEGSGVPIVVYSKEEVRDIFKKSIQILTDHGFDRPRSFRAGGWMMDAKIQQVLCEQEFALDSSQVPPELIKERCGGYFGYQWMLELWPNTTITIQPYGVQYKGKNLWEFPDNGALMDDTSSEQLFLLFKKIVDEYVNDPHRPYFLVSGFHQETANLTLPELKKFLSKVDHYSHTHSDIPISYPSLPLNLNTH